MFPAVAALRVSTENQADNGYSLPTQEKEIREYAASSGYRVEAVFSDDISGDILDRPGLRELWAFVKAHPSIRAIFWHTVDRIGRDDRVILPIIWRAEDLGLQTYTVAEGLCSSDNVVTLIHTWKAKQDKKAILAKLSRGVRGKIEGAGDGKPRPLGNGIAPYGYRWVGRKRETTLEPVPEQAEVVRLIYRLHSGAETGEPMLMYHITRYLSERRIPTLADVLGRYKKQGPGVWNTGTIYKILTNPVYRGEMRFYLRESYLVETEGGRVRRQRRRQDTGEIRYIPVPAIIDPEEWEAAQKRIKANRVHRPGNAEYRYLVARRIKCSCGYRRQGRKWTGDGKTPRYLYTCPGHNNAGRMAHSCRVASFDARQVDRLVWEYVEGYVLNPEKLEQGLRDLGRAQEGRLAELEGQATRYREQLGQLEQELERAYQGFYKGYVKESLYLKTKGELEALQQQAQESLQAVEEQLKTVAPTEGQIMALRQFSADIREALSITTEEDRQHIVAMLGVEVECRVTDGREKQIKISCYLPGSEEIRGLGMPASFTSTQVYQSCRHTPRLRLETIISLRAA